MSREPRVTGRQLLLTTGFLLMTLCYLPGTVLEEGGWRAWVGVIAALIWTPIFILEARDYLRQRRSGRDE
ncbi:MAG TPA: hypothetical protein VN408_23780 [Actinoplanes sp.]|nr:hypothetical protein [Actinoplanes sp.]